MASVLFVCTGNMYRSPIAAEIFRNLLQQNGQHTRWQVGSAGTWTTEGRLAPNDAIEIARSFGINLGTHQTRMVNKKMLEEVDLIIVMEEGHKEALQVEFPFAQNKTHLLSYVTQGVNYDIADPASARGETRTILQEMANMIRAGYANIYKLAEYESDIR
jgi:protein-tyrosine phosphatase